MKELTLIQKQDRLIQEFSDIQDWEDRYKKIIEKGKSLQKIPSLYQTEENKVRGCQSQVWLFAELDSEGRMLLHIDSDAMIVRGLVAILKEICSGEKPQSIIEADFYFFKQAGLQDHLSLNRSQGLLAIIKQIKFVALAYSLKNK